MNSYYKLVIVLSRFTAVLIILFDVYSAFSSIILMGLFGGYRNAPPLAFTAISLLLPVAFSLIIWFGSGMIAKHVSRCVD